jgi:hypothetical protein
MEHLGSILNDPGVDDVVRDLLGLTWRQNNQDFISIKVIASLLEADVSNFRDIYLGFVLRLEFQFNLLSVAALLVKVPAEGQPLRLLETGNKAAT